MHQRSLHLYRSVSAFLCVASLVVLSAPNAYARPVPPSSEETPFLFGCDWPVNGSPAVKALFYEMGGNFVRISGGGYGWALADHKKAMEELNAHHVKVLLQLASHYPDGKYFALKDSYFIDQKGETGKEDRNAWAITYDGSAWPQYSYASTTLRQELAKDFTAYLNGIKDQKNIHAFLLHNEPGYHWLTDRVFDYNPQSIARFHIWLQQQHGTLDTLNKRWGTTFTSFDAVEPPHELPPASNIAAWMDWRRFNSDLIQDFLKSQITFAKRIRPTIPTSTNLSGPLDNWYPVRVGDNYRYTSDFDIAGIDIYPTEWTTPIFPGYAMDMTRGAAQRKKIYVEESEVFDPTRFTHLSEPQRADMLRAEIWSFIGHGADAVLLWSLSGQGSFRLTEGEFNERVAVTREIAHLSPMLNLGNFKKPEHKVAICVDQDTYLYYGGKAPKLDGGGKADRIAKGMYAAVVAGRHEADVISVSQLQQGIGKQYQAIILPMSLMVDEKLAAQLRAYVSGGGFLIAEAPFATNDRWGGALPQSPGLGLSEVFGIRNVRPSGMETARITTRVGTFDARNAMQFTLAGASVIGTFADKKPAITLNIYGKGGAIYIAAEVSEANTTQWGTGLNADAGLRKFVTASLSQYGRVAPSVRLTHQGAPESYLDTSSRTDAKGNRLIVLATATNKIQQPPLVTNVNLFPYDSLTPSVQAFIFPVPHHSGGRTTAGPQLLPTHVGQKSLPLPDIISALPVLLARDFTPLLSLTAPESAEEGKEIEIEMVCYNPSSRPVTVNPNLVLPAAWKITRNPQSFVIPARGQYKFSFGVRSGGGKRTPIKGQIQYSYSKGKIASVESVPVDIFTNNQK